MPRKQITYSPQDFGKTAVELQARYFAVANEHPEFTLNKWQKLLSQFPHLEDTEGSYWEWVVTMIAADDEETPEVGHAQQVNVTENDLIDVVSVEQFAELVGRWHQNKVAVLRHMQSIPLGTEMELTIGEKSHMVKLEGEIMFGFQAGLELALIEISNLPFVASTEDVPAEANAADPSQG